MTAEASCFVPYTVEHGLAQVRLKRALVARLELLQSAQRIDDGVLNEILRIERATGRSRETAASPSAQRRYAARVQALECVAIALPDEVQQLLSGFERIRGGPSVGH